MNSMKFGRLAVVAALAILPTAAKAASAGATHGLPSATSTDCIVGLESIDETGDVHMRVCDEAESWMWANSESKYETKRPITDHIAVVQVLGGSYTRMRLFDANGTVIGEGDVRVPHSANGGIYVTYPHPDGGGIVRYGEAAPDGWSGTSKDPSAATIAEARKLIDDYNASLTPHGDWVLGSLGENDTLLNNKDMRSVVLNPGDHAGTYWSSDTPEGVARFVRPVRHFSLNEDGSLVVDTPEVTTTTISATKNSTADEGSNLLVRGVPVLLVLLLLLIAGAATTRRRRKS